MSIEYTDEYYCSTCQSTGEYPSSISVSVLACASQNEYITEELYNQMRASLESIRVFGDYDDRSVRQPAVRSLTNKTSGTIIYPDYYNDIASKVFSNYSAKSSGDIIYGTYFSDLKTAVLNYRVPSTRYYTVSYECCDYCDDAPSCPGYQPCASYQCSGCEGEYGGGVCQGYCGNGNGC